MSNRCFWCNCDIGDALKGHEAPGALHSTWCPHYRRPPLPPGARRVGNTIVVDGLRFKVGSGGPDRTDDRQAL